MEPRARLNIKEPGGGGGMPQYRGTLSARLNIKELRGLPQYQGTGGGGLPQGDMPQYQGPGGLPQYQGTLRYYLNIGVRWESKERR